MATSTPAEHAPTAHTEAPAHGGAEAHGAFPPFDPTYFASQILWLAITFVAFYLIMKKVALPRIAGILEVRRDRIASDLDHAQRLKEQSDQAVAAYEQALTEARAKAYKIAEEGRGQSVAASEARRHETEAELGKKLAAAEKRIGEIKEKALSEVGTIAADAAEAIVSSLSGGAVSRDEADKAVAAVMRS